MSYRQITPDERYTLSVLRRQVPPMPVAHIARMMGRHRSTIGRELARNSARFDGAYRPSKAQERTNGRRSRSRRNEHFGARDWHLIEGLLAALLSPEQISRRLRDDGLLKVSHETIYKHVWRNKHRGGQLYRSLRQPFKRRKRRGTYEKRGRVLGKRHISERPAAVELRQEIGHWEMDTVIGAGSKDCIVTLVERVTGMTLIGKLADRTVGALNKRVLTFIRRHRDLFKTISVDNGTEFHGYRAIEKATGVLIYFATPYHSWERGTNENTNGLIRQYLPKRRTMRGLTQTHCNTIAHKLNLRPRKRHGFRNPYERLQQGMGRRYAAPVLDLQRLAGVRSRHVSVAVQS
jgi:transposase, IS30 family